ncbi:MAG: sugar ABC transporter substrate-binding protein [Chloroflexi bacterium]|nr:sugar ABC transporter substrate-binding protein [Chloroflexota bacterium]
MGEKGVFLSKKRTRREFLIDTAKVGVGVTLGAVGLSNLVGCAPRATPTLAPAATPTAAPAATPTPAPPAKVDLLFWYSSPADPLIQGVEDGAKRFMDSHPNISVATESFPYAEFFQKLETAWAGGGGPDASWNDFMYIPVYADAGTIIPLDDYLPAGFLDDYLPAVVEDMEYKGKIWMANMHLSTEAILYHEDMLDEAGIRKPRSYDENWSWDEFLDACLKLTKRSGDVTEVWGIVTQYPPSIYSVQPFIHQNGGKIWDGTTFDGFLNSPETIEAIQFFVDLAGKHKVFPVETIPDIFQTRKVAMILSNPFVFRDIQNRYPDLKVGVAPCPHQKTSAVQGGGWCISISANSKHKDLAWELAYEGWLSQETNTRWIDVTGYMPARKSVRDALDWVKEYPWSIFMEGLEKYMVHRPKTHIYGFLNDQFNDMLRDGMLGVDVKAKIEAMVPKLEAELAKYK